ncbi:MAG: dTMP kinase [Gammaproteobacteria bacterium]|nr:dTMP kinase [Gammaproteobacteria bacterium]
MNTSVTGHKGIFITLEGGEGAGKSTSLAFLENGFRQYGHEVLLTREPGGTVLGEKVREILLHATDLHIVPDAELLLMFAARAQHLQTCIEPALGQGKVVLCDRFTDASYAYQGAGRGIDADRIKVLEQWVQGSRRPDVTLLFDLPVTQGLKRANSRSEPDRFEREQQAFFERVRAGYLAIAKKEPDRVKVIDASKSIEQVQLQLEMIVEELVTGHGD